MEGAVKSAIEIVRALGFQTVETQQVQALRVEEAPVKGHGQKSELELQEKLDQLSTAPYGIIGAAIRIRTPSVGKLSLL